MDGVFVAGHWVVSGVLRHADVARSWAVGMLAYDEPCGDLRHAGVGRVQAETGSWRRWEVGVRGWRGGAGGVFQDFFFGPCGHAATSSSSPLIEGAPPRSSSSTVVGHSCYAAVPCTHSANCADDRRDSSGAALGPVIDMPVVVQRHMHSPRVSRSSTSLSWRRGCLPWS